MDRSRTIAACLTIGAAGVFVATIYPMARRIAEFNAHANLLTLHAEPIVQRDIKVEGFPPATLTDDFPEHPAPGMSAIRLDVVGGGKPTQIPVKRPPALHMPNLAAYDEWLKVLAIYEVVRDDQGEQRRKVGSERVVIVVRRTPEGYDPETWGEVRRIDWVFDFYDLKRDGAVEKTTRRWPRKYGAENRLHDEGANKGGKYDPQTVAAAQAMLNYEPLKQRTAEYFIAMHVIPKLNVPEYKFDDTAFSIDVLGWMLPASMCSFLVFTGALVFALAPRRREPLA